MRLSFLLLIALLVFTACKSTREPKTAVGKTPPAGRAQTVEPRTTTRAVNAVRGRVVSVREDLRFAIVDFTGGKMPVLDQQLTVYRLDQKVAELRVSGPYRGTTAAADITAGDAKMGDLVRDR